METWISFVELAVVPVLVAIITAVGVWLGNRKGEARAALLRAENSSQHAEGRVLLTHLSSQVGGIDAKVDRLDRRLDNVAIWQAEHEKEHLTDGSQRPLIGP